MSTITFFSILLLCMDAGTADYVISNGGHKFRQGDDMSWARQDYNDFDWQGIDLFVNRRLKTINEIGWHRVYFTLPEGTDPPSAIFLGRPGDADEVFLNGVKIGGEGVIGSRFVEAAKVERLYRISTGVLRFGKDNLLAVRVMSPNFKGGLSKGSIKLGSYNELLISKIKHEGVTKRVETSFFAVFVI